MDGWPVHTSPPSPPGPGVIRILFLGDIFGEPGRKAVAVRLPQLKEELSLDFIIVNGENAAGGRGITPKICIGLMRAGATVVTTGDHAWDQQEIVSYMNIEPRLLRPLNYPPGTPGQGSIVLETDKGKVAVLNLQGRVFMAVPLENPFLAVEAEVAALRLETPVIFVDFHAEATSEKVSMGWHLDGKVSGIAGTHTHVQTSDERILPKGTAYITDAGMCGPRDSVIGSKVDVPVHRFLTGMPGRLMVADGPVQICGVWLDVETATGRALQVHRIHEFITLSA